MTDEGGTVAVPPIPLQAPFLEDPLMAKAPSQGSGRALVSTSNRARFPQEAVPKPEQLQGALPWFLVSGSSLVSLEPLYFCTFSKVNCGELLCFL